MLGLPAGLVAAALLAVSSPASAATKPRLTFFVAPNGDFFGFVKDPPACEVGRKVRVYKVVGEKPNRKRDKVYAEDVAEDEAGYVHAIWEAGRTRRGRFYAHTRAIDGCQALRSKVKDLKGR